MKDSGIYKITCLSNGRVYIGSAVSISGRWNNHIRTASDGKHHNRHFQNAWSKYKAEAFVFEILEMIEDVTLLIEREQHWMNFYSVTDPTKGFNIAPRAGSQLGLKFPESSKLKMAKRMAGKKLPQWWRERIAKSLTGKTRPQSVKDALSKWHTGRKRTPEQCARMSASQIGIVRTDEWRSNLSKALSGVKKNAEHVRKMAQKHRRLSDEQVSEIVESFKHGATTAGLAREYGLSQQTVVNNFKRIGFDYSPYLIGRKHIRKLSTDDYGIIRSFRSNGMPVSEIAARFKVHWSRIYMIIKSRPYETISERDCYQLDFRVQQVL
jgi:group I intron endonuclease